MAMATMMPACGCIVSPAAFLPLVRSAKIPTVKLTKNAKRGVRCVVTPLLRRSGDGASTLRRSMNGSLVMVRASGRAADDENNTRPVWDADANRHSLEVMDPVTGEYKYVAIPKNKEELSEEEAYARGAYQLEEDEEPFSFERNEELLRKYGPMIGLKDDEDYVGKVVRKMRNPASYKIVKQLEEGMEDVEDLLKATYCRNADIQALFSQVDSLIRKGDQSSARDVVEGNYVALLEQLHEGIFGIEQLSLLNILASFYVTLEDKDAADQLLGQTKELLDLIPDTEDAIDNVLEHTASLYMKLNNPKQALPLFTRSLSIRKALGAKDVPSIVRTLIGLANTYTELDLGAKSTEVYKQVLAYTEEVLGSEDEDLAAPLMHLGGSLLEDGKLNEAEMALERAMSLTEKSYGGKDARYGVAICLLAQVRAKKAEMEDAVELFRKGIRVLEDSQDYEEASALNTIRMDLAALLSVIGREKESEDVWKKVSVEDFERPPYFSHRQVEYLRTLAENYADEGELEKSERALRRCLQLLVASVGPDATEVSVVLQILAILLHAQPDRENEAEPLVRESIRIREQKFGKHHIAVGEAYCYLASILHQKEEDKEAIDLMYKVIQIQEQEFGSDSPQLVETLEVLLMMLESLRRYQETVPIIQRLEHLKAQAGSSSST